MGVISGETVIATWYDPRQGISHRIGELPNAGISEFVPPSSGRGNDWVLILDDASQNFPQP